MRPTGPWRSCATGARPATTDWRRDCATSRCSDGRLRLECEPIRWALRLLDDDAMQSLSALCVVRSADGCWLAGRRAAWLATWAQRWALGAAGSVEVGENPADTLVRELTEEWSVTAERLTVEALVKLPSGLVSLVGMAWLADGAEVTPDSEHDEFAWWPADRDAVAGARRRTAARGSPSSSQTCLMGLRRRLPPDRHVPTAGARLVRPFGHLPGAARSAPSPSAIPSRRRSSSAWPTGRSGSRCRWCASPRPACGSFRSGWRSPSPSSAASGPFAGSVGFVVADRRRRQAGMQGASEPSASAELRSRVTRRLHRWR